MIGKIANFFMPAIIPEVRELQDPPAIPTQELCVKGKNGASYPFQVGGHATPAQIAQLTASLQAFSPFLGLFSSGIETSEGKEEPLKIRFVSVGNLKNELIADGMSREDAEKKQGKIAGLYRNNTIWLVSGHPYAVPFHPGGVHFEIAGTAEHELAHALDDFLFQRTEQDKEVGYFSDLAQVELSALWRQDLGAAGLGANAVEQYFIGQRYLRTFSDALIDPLQIQAADSARALISDFETKIRQTFVSIYAASGYWGQDEFSEKATLREYFAENIETFLDENEKSKLETANRTFYCALESFFQASETDFNLALSPLRFQFDLRLTKEK